MSVIYLSKEDLAEKYRRRQELEDMENLCETANDYQQQAMRRRMASQLQQNERAVSSCMSELQNLKQQAAHYLDIVNTTTKGIASLEEKLRTLNNDTAQIRRQLYGGSQSGNFTVPSITGYDEFYSTMTRSWRERECDKARRRQLQRGHRDNINGAWRDFQYNESKALKRACLLDYSRDSLSEEEDSQMHEPQRDWCSNVPTQKPRRNASSARNRTKRNRTQHVPVAFDEFDYLGKKTPALPPMDDQSYLQFFHGAKGGNSSHCINSSRRGSEGVITSRSHNLKSYQHNYKECLDDCEPSSSNSLNFRSAEARQYRQNLITIIDKYLNGCTYSLISIFPPLDRLYQLFTDALPALAVIRPSNMIGVSLYKVAVFVHDLLDSDAFYRFVISLEPVDLPLVPPSLAEAQTLLEHGDRELLPSSKNKAIYTKRSLLSSIHHYIRAHWFDSIQSSFVNFLHRYYLRFLRANDMAKITVPIWDQYQRVRLFNAEKHLLRDGELDFLFLYSILSSFAILHEMFIFPIEKTTYGYNELKAHEHIIDQSVLAQLQCGPKRYTCLWPAWADKYGNVFIGLRFCKLK